MKKQIEKVPVVVEYTEGFERRFTEGILKIYEKRIRQQKQTRDEKEVEKLA